MLDYARWSWPEQKQGNQIAKGNSNKFLFCAFFPAPVYFSFAFITFLSCVQINASLKKIYCQYMACMEFNVSKRESLPITLLNNKPYNNGSKRDTACNKWMNADCREEWSNACVVCAMNRIWFGRYEARCLDSCRIRTHHTQRCIEPQSCIKCDLMSIQFLFVMEWTNRK